jgi:hypothetical protein
MRSKKEIQKRAAVIRKATPNILEELFEMQNRICDLCGEWIQNLVLAELDHSISVMKFAKGPLSTKKATIQANDPSNLRAAHAFCNSSKHDMTRDDWFARDMDKKVGKPRVWTQEEIEEFRKRMSEDGRAKGGYTQGQKNIETGHIQALGRVQGPKNVANLDKVRTYENTSKGGDIQGQRNVETGRAQELGNKFGPVQGQKNIDNGHWEKIRSKGQEAAGRKNVETGWAQELGRIWGKINAMLPQSIEGQNKGRHTRWHTNRGIINSDCPLCKKAA